jgi:hypothetical protein
LFALKKSSAVLRTGAIADVAADAQMLAFTRSLSGERVRCVFNLSRNAASTAWAEKTGAPLITCGEATLADGQLRLAPLSGYVARV